MPAKDEYEVRRRDEWRNVVPLLPYVKKEIRKSRLRFKYREGHEGRYTDSIGNSGSYSVFISNLYNESGRPILTIEEWFYKEISTIGDPLSMDEENIKLSKFDVYFVYDRYDSLAENILEDALKSRRMHLLFRKILNQL